MAQWLKLLSQGWKWWHSSAFLVLTGGDGKAGGSQKLGDKLDMI